MGQATGGIRAAPPSQVRRLARDGAAGTVAELRFWNKEEGTMSTLAERLECETADEFLACLDPILEPIVSQYHER